MKYFVILLSLLALYGCKKGEEEPDLKVEVQESEQGAEMSVDVKEESEER